MRKRQLSLLGLLALVLAGCADDGIAAPEETMVGTYALQSVNGQSLPFVEEDDTTGTRFEIVGIEIDFAEDGTYALRQEFRVTEAGGAATTEHEYANGTWTLTGTNLSLTEDGELISAVLDGNSFTVSVEGMTFVFRKR